MEVYQRYCTCICVLFSQL